MSEPLNEAEMIKVREGFQSEALLGSEIFTATFKTLGFECFEAFTQSKPEDKELREQTYYQYRGLVAIEERLRALVQEKDEIERRLNAEQDDDDQII